jgi:proteasome accessory factor B
MSAAKLERLLNLTALLLETPRPLPATEIRERLGAYPDDDDAFRRAFERDKADLHEMGVPLARQKVPGTDPVVDGYRIPKDRYYLKDPGLTPDELAALRLAASVVQLDGLSATEGLLKLGGFVGVGDGGRDGGRDGDPTGVSGTGVGGAGVGLAVGSLPGVGVAELFGAIAAQTPVRFDYKGERRTVDPYRLDFRRGRWYLSGHDHSREAERLFRLDRFESAVDALDGPRFERPAVAEPGQPLDPWLLGDGDAVEAELLVDAAQAPWIVQHLGAGAVLDERPDGSVVVTMTVTNRDNFRSFVLTFLDHAEVLAPDDLRAEIVAWLRRQAA